MTRALKRAGLERLKNLVLSPRDFESEKRA